MYKKKYIFSIGILLIILVASITGCMLMTSWKHQSENQLPKDKRITIEAMSNSYRLYEQEDVFTKEECNRVIAYMKPKMKRSTVAGKTERDVSNDRTSKTGWIKYYDEEMSFFTSKLRNLGRKLTGIRDDDMYEDVSIVQYEPGQLYRPHFDACTTMRNCKNNMRIYRIATIIVYLNDDFEGGETNFPKAKKKVKPVTGKIVYFEDTDNQGKEIPESLHEGVAVKNGEKWIATLWIKFKPSPENIKFLNNYK